MMGWAMILVCVIMIKSINKICRASTKQTQSDDCHHQRHLRQDCCDQERMDATMGEVSIVISMNVTSSDKTSWPKKLKCEIQIITEYQSAEQFSLWSALSHLENDWSSKTCKTSTFINLILTLFGNVREHSCSLLCRMWIDWPSVLFSSYCDIDTQGNKALVMKQYLSDEKVANFSTDEWYPAF